MKMTLDKVREVVRGYQREFSCRPEFGNKVDDDFDAGGVELQENEAMHDHVSYMLAEILKMCDEGRAEKAMRWLGFVQGVLWCAGLRTLGQLKTDSMPNGAEYDANA